jgi:hypothetical protein
MMDPTQLLAALRSQITGTFSRTDVLVPLVMLVGMLLIALLILVAEKAASWLVIVMLAIFVVVIFLYGFAYLYCLFRNIDALRSDKFVLAKNAIDRGLLGDSLQGLFDLDTEASSMTIEGTAEQSEAEK